MQTDKIKKPERKRPVTCLFKNGDQPRNKIALGGFDESTKHLFNRFAFKSSNSENDEIRGLTHSTSRGNTLQLS